MQQFIQAHLLDILGAGCGSLIAVIWFCVEQKIIESKKEKSLLQLILEL